MGKFYVVWCFFCLFGRSFGLPAALLYDYNVQEAVRLPKGDEVSSPIISLKVPIIFFGEAFDTIYVNNNGLLSFKTEIPNFLNLEFPLDYPAIAPFYSNVDTTEAGTVSYYETEDPGLLQRATENVHDQFLEHGNFQATSLFIATWEAVGYHNKKSDKVNTYQVVIATDGVNSFVEFLYPENGIQWIQGTGDELSGLPDARAQAGFISSQGKVFTLPASGTEQISNLEKWSNMNLMGQWTFEIDEDEINEPDQNNSGKPNKNAGKTCAEAPTYCHVHGKCTDYEEGFCCACDEAYYGNGRFCVRKDTPLRVNGKITGTINGEKLGTLDLQSYVVMVDARAYTAISEIPESVGSDIQSLQILGSVIGYLFAKPIRGAINGYQLTGGVFNHTAQILFKNTNQSIIITQKYHGLDLFDQLRLEANIQGEIPNLPDDAKVIIDEYQEEYTVTAPGVLQLSSTRIFKYNDANGVEIVHPYNVYQIFQFEECKFINSSQGNSWKLKVGKNFISYESTERIIRFGLSNKVTPIGDYDPCEEGRTKCQENSVCVVENDSYRCACKPGFQYFQTENGTTICGDTNECAIGIADCDYNAYCINLVGSYKCQCHPGFEGNGQVCENALNCQNVRCNENAECVETNGLASCRCVAGFSGNGQICQPRVGQSCHVNNNCSPYGMCQIDPATDEYRCLCLPGFEGDGYRCRQIITTTTSTEANSITTTIEVSSSTEGQVPTPSSSERSTDVTEAVFATTTDRVPQNCDNTTCWCPEKFVLDQQTKYCVRVEDYTEMSTLPYNESCNELNNCHEDAQCKYNPVASSFNCVCNEGYEGDGLACTALKVSCLVENNCDSHAVCTYDEALGRSKCVCMSGYEGDGYTCTLAICTSNEDCSATEECLYTNARRYECVCKEGYVRDSQNLCVDGSSTCGGGTCVENAECLYDETYETHYCSCKTGYVGDGITECKLKPVGCNILNNCGLHAVCIYDEPSEQYYCKCQTGHYGDGFVCHLEQNCLVIPSMCDPNASCVADANRSYNCQCNYGFIGNGTTCRSNPTHEGGFLLLNQGMATLKLPLEDSRDVYGRAVQVKAAQTSVGLDIDCFGGKFFWSDITGKAIRSAYYNGSDKEDFIKEGIGSPEGIAIDWVSRNIYWTDSTKDTIDVTSLDGKRRVTLINTDLVNPRGIAVHPQRGKIFWTDWNRLRPKIEWANADGTERAIFLEGKDVSLPNSLTIDYDTEELCYADAGTKKIECVQIDSRQRRTMATNCTYPFGIAVNDRYIFWSDWISKRVERVNKLTLQRLPPLPLPLVGAGRVFQVVAVPLRCPPLQNICQYKDQCPPEHICLPNGRGSKTCTCTYKANSPLERPTCNLPSTQKQVTIF